MANKPPPETFFDVRTGGYWLRSNGRFLNLDKCSMVMHLKHAGLSAQKQIGHLTELENWLYCSQTQRAVDYAGPLAGHKMGPVKLSSGATILVTSEPDASVWETPSGSDHCPKLERFLDQLFGAAQLPVVMAWLKLARESLRKLDFRPGQMLVLAGPANCGKSLFQALVTEWLGGRSARPYQYMTGATPFNADLAQAEHLVIEDEHGSTDIRARLKFAAAIKVFTVNKEMSVHAKGRTAITLPTYRRITVSVNDEPENLMILPPLDGSIQDKLTLIHCRPATVPDDRRALWESFTRELPRLAVMLHRWRIPKRLESPRWGVSAYHAPALFEALADVAPESRLLNLIDEVIFGKPDAECWDGSAEQLEKHLRASSFNFAVDKLLHYSSAGGVYLGRLAKRFPARFVARKRAGKTIWAINKPTADE